LNKDLKVGRRGDRRGFYRMSFFNFTLSFPVVLSFALIWTLAFAYQLLCYFFKYFTMLSLCKYYAVKTWKTDRRDEKREARIKLGLIELAISD
jgi:hypothetical protein